MPTTYTHDLFGKQVYRMLPGDMKEIIRNNGDLYRIGLHGPDILFYYLFKKKVHRHGVQMHHETARGFFEKGIEKARKEKDEALLAYLLGFGCHYLLDSSCHPFVNETAKAGILSHTLLEKEFDRMLMIRTGRDPHHFYPSDCIEAKKAYAKTIHKAIPEISSEKIFWSLKWQKWITNAMVYDNHGRRVRMLRFLGRLLRKKDTEKHLEHFMTKDPVPGSEGPVQDLYTYYEKELETAAGELKELYALFLSEIPLSERWDKTYSG